MHPRSLSVLWPLVAVVCLLLPTSLPAQVVPDAVVDALAQSQGGDESSNEEEQSGDEADGETDGQGSSGETEPDNGTAQSVGGSSRQAAPEYRGTWFSARTLELHRPASGELPNLETPLAAMEAFRLSAKDEDYDTAAAVLDLRLLAASERADVPELARRLHYVMIQKTGFAWDSLPDRPDGQDDFLSGKGDLDAGSPVRSIHLGQVPLTRRDVPIRLNRIKPEGQAPVWVFSAQTVENIDAMYQANQPGWLARQMPAWASVQTVSRVELWQWPALVVVLLLGWLAGWIIARVLGWLLESVDGLWTDGLSEHVRLPVSVWVGAIVAYALIRSLLSIGGPVGQWLEPLLLMVIILALAWTAMAVVTFFTRLIIRSGDDDVDVDDPDADQRKRLLTSLSIGRRVAVFVILLVGVGVVFAQLDLTRTLGLSFLGGAGIATILLGIAAQHTLGNIFAGIQISTTQHVRIGDNVKFEGDWGWIEEITYTYLTIRTWDQRRVVVPLKYFLSTTVENWTRRDPHLLKPIYLHVDHSVDVGAVRKKFDQLLRADDAFDEKSEPEVIVYDLQENTVVLRAVASAKDPSTAWDLHCRLREQLLEFLQQTDGGRFLPRDRVEVDGAAKLLSR